MVAMEPTEGLASQSQAKILIVDDRRENLLTLEAVLEPLGEQVVTAISGADALRCLLRDDFAVVLMDAQMPNMDGFETAAIIRQRERTKHLPIIFVTAYSKNHQEVTQGYSVGAVDYLTKPYDPDILRSKVKVFVELHKRGEEIKRQQELIREAEAREAERLMQEQARQLEQEHMRQLAMELEGRVAERTAQLVAANEELEAFCYSVSHDLRTPLRAIASTSRILLEDAGTKLEQEEIEYLKRQETAATRLGTLIDDLLQLSRLGRRTLEKRELDFTALAREVFEEILAKDWTVAPTLEIENGLVAKADPGMLRLLLLNLIDNGCKYSPEGAHLCIGWKWHRDHPVYYVKDTGIGFDMNYAHKIFLPFERLHLENEFPGTGIGLASVERIVRRHGGRVWVESEQGKGSTFYFTLGEVPAIQADAVSVI